MDSKKKKNKKKRGNQQNATSNSEKVTVKESNNEPSLEENQNTDNSTITEIHSFAVSESDVEHDRHKMNEESIAKLQEQLETSDNKRTLLLQKQVDLEEKINFLQKEVVSCVKKEATLEEKICQFEIENGRLIQRQAVLEGKLENAENIKESFTLTENLLKERIAVVEEAHSALDMQVKELEGSRITYFEANQQLMEKIAALELRIQSIEGHSKKAASRQNLTERITEFPEDTFPGQHAEAPSMLSGNQTLENADFSEKVNAEYVEHFSVTGLNQSKTLNISSSATSYNVSEYSEKTIKPGEGVQEKLVDNGSISYPLPSLDQRRLREDVSAPVPFDEIEIDGSTEVPMHVHVHAQEAEPVDFSDAPLTGAPFRLISFMARFVSGADLVEKSSNSRAGQ